MSRPDEPYLRVSEYARHFHLDPSTVYKKIERGEIRSIRIGKTIRIPSSEVERHLDPAGARSQLGTAQDSQPRHLTAQLARFEEAAGRTPSGFVEAWRGGQIEDTPEMARLAIEALALRAAIEQRLALRAAIEQRRPANTH
jgi:excisionase family DNA binding protein